MSPPSIILWNTSCYYKISDNTTVTHVFSLWLHSIEHSAQRACIMKLENLFKEKLSKSFCTFIISCQLIISFLNYDVQLILKQKAQLFISWGSVNISLPNVVSNIKPFLMLNGRCISCIVVGYCGDSKHPIGSKLWSLTPLKIMKHYDVQIG